MENDDCEIEAKSSTFTGSRTECSVKNNKITITSPLSTQKKFEGGTTMQVTLKQVINPISVRNVGSFTISSFTRVNG